MTIRYQLSDVEMGEEEAQAVAEVVRGKWLSIGPRTKQFEEQFAAYLGTEHAVAVSSCTAALHLALEAASVGPGDEVLVPSLTFVASANSILYQRANPVFVEISSESDLNLSVADVAAKITPRTKAIIVVHFAGFPADMDGIMQLADEHGLIVIEDACHAIGATCQGADGSRYTGRKAGTIGHVGCFSFFANKNLVTGEGGMLVTDNEQIASRARLARSHGMTKSSWDKAAGRAFDYDIEEIGYNYRCTELTAALGQIQLGKLDRCNERRRECVAAYRTELLDTPGISVPFADRLEDSSHHIFPVLLDRGIDRDALRQSLQERGVQTSVHYPPVHHFTHYRREYPLAQELELTVDVAARELTLPLHPLLSREDVAEISHALQESLMVSAT